jgi:glycosyltransferase involved in cell wall biosynthesis
MAAAIRELAENTTLLQQIRNNCAELSKRFDRDAIARRTEKILVAITEGTTLPEIRW